MSLLTPKAVLFDLDGTLIDSAPDIAAAVNELLATRGLPPLPVPRVTSMIGNGVELLVERAFSASGMSLQGEALARAQRDMTPIYMRHTVELTRLYPGAAEALRALHDAGLKLGLATNKMKPATIDVLTHFDIASLFDTVVGADEVANKKPAPDMLLLALRQLGVAPAEAVMVGDSASDVGAAHAAGMRAILLRGGYSLTPVDDLGADMVLDGITELPAALAIIKSMRAFSAG